MKHAWILVLVVLLWSSSSFALERGLVLIPDADGRHGELYDKSHALVIGVSQYTSGWPSLFGVPDDVRQVQATLQNHGFEVTLVEDPDHNQLRRAFTDFIAAHGNAPDNRLLFYFAGHGTTLEQSYGGEMGYIVPTDAPLPETDRPAFLAKALDMRAFDLFARRIQSKHALFLFDSCFSGSIFALSRAVPMSISYKTARPVRQFITSGSKDETVPDQSIFRQQFLAALAGEGDTNGDGYVSGTELGEFLQSQVVNYSYGAQHPQYGKLRDPYLDKGDFVFAMVSAPEDQESDQGHGVPPIDAPGSEFPPAAPAGSDFVGSVEKINSEYNFITVKLERPISSSSKLYLKGADSKRIEIELLEFNKRYASAKPDGYLHRIRIGDPIYVYEQ